MSGNENRFSFKPNPAFITSFIIGLLLCLTGATMMFFDIGADPVRIIIGIIGICVIGISNFFGIFFK